MENKTSRDTNRIIFSFDQREANEHETGNTGRAVGALFALRFIGKEEGKRKGQNKEEMGSGLAFAVRNVAV